MAYEMFEPSMAGSDAIGAMLTGVIVTMFAAMAIILLVFLGIYLYLSFTHMSIGKKAKVNAPGLVWIPGVGPLLIAYFSDKRNTPMPWWILLGSIGAYIIG